MDDYDFGFQDFIDILPDDVGQTGTDPTTGGGTSSGGFDWGSVLGGIDKLFKGTSPLGKAGALVAAGGIGKLLENMFGGSQQGPAGYQGGIPVYTASRQQTPTSVQRPAGYRPGQGGITYFTPMTYTATGKDMAAPAAGDVIGGGGLGTLPTTQPSGPVTRPPAATEPTPGRVFDIPNPRIPTVGSPERVEFEQRLASQMTPEQFRELQASPYSVLSPSFDAAVQANLAGKEELARRGMSSMFGRGLQGQTPKDVSDYLTAIQIERPMGGHLRSDNDLNALMSQYLDALDSGDIGNAFAARNRLRTLGVGPDVLNPALEIMRPGINDRSYYKYYDPSNPNAKGLPMDLEGVFAPGGGGNPWAVVAQQKEKYGLTDDQIAYALGMTSEEVKRSLPKPPGAASGGYMPSGIAMLARGGNGGRYLRGPGDGVSDSIPAKFERSGQPARLADGEFVIDARTVSELGNGSSEAGARKLYAMMDRVHRMRKQAKRGKPSGADRELNKLVRGK